MRSIGSSNPIENGSFCTVATQTPILIANQNISLKLNNYVSTQSSNFWRDWHDWHETSDLQRQAFNAAFKAAAGETTSNQNFDTADLIVPNLTNITVERLSAMLQAR